MKTGTSNLNPKLSVSNFSYDDNLLNIKESFYFMKQATIPRHLDRQVLTTVHNHTIDILKSRGFRFCWPKAVEIFRRHGFKTERDIVYFTGDRIESALQKVPSEITLLARDEQYHLKLDLDTVSFGLGRGAIYVVAKDGGRRQAKVSDLVLASKLAQQLPEIEHWQPLFFPGDIPDKKYAMCMTQIMIKYQTKPYLIAGPDELGLVLLAFGGITVDQAQEMSRRGFSYGQGTVNTLSPLTLIESECRSLVAFAEYGLLTQITPMPLAGSTAPCTIMGVVVQQNCEILAPLVLSQLINPGCPILYGNMGSGSDMRSMSGSYGSAESRLIEYIAGKLAKHYGLLTRGGIGITDSEYEGFQAGAEAMFQAHNAMSCQSNLVIGMGIMGGYIGASLRKIMLDAELVNYVRSFFRKIDLSHESTAVDHILNTPFGGNFVQTPHTLAHCRKEHYAPKIFERKPPELWREGSHRDFIYAVDEKVAKQIEAYLPPEFDAGLAKELDRAFCRYLPENFDRSLRICSD